jgi:hypothetical protein
MDTTLKRLNIRITPAGINQIQNGQIVTNPNDRQEFPRVLSLIADPQVAEFIALLLPAVQKMR